MADADILYAAVLQHMQGGVLAIGMDGRVQAFNPAAERLLGRPAERMQGEVFASLFFDNPANDGFTQTVLNAIYDAADPHHQDVQYHRADGPVWLNVTTSVLWTADGPGEASRKAGVVVLFVDITERKAAEAALRQVNDDLERRVDERTRDLAATNYALKLEIAERVRAQERLAHLADHDALTGLPNRRLFEQRLGEIIRAGEPFALLYLDLDGFKPVNDTHGHQMGDWLLRSVSRRLSLCVREGDTLARLGGDEFAVLLRSSTAEDGVLSVVHRVIERVSEPYHAETDIVLSIGVSVGYALHPQPGVGLRELLQAADAAMYEAKRAGRGTWRKAACPAF
ncbi:diguanylate cyclase [Ancylobacter sp. A5.8]|uniref:GGDEF domain-containing protein n=1 Tax=Ancylobacter gelatini TaxID=2919920 RepID=UPI001F4D3B85|nr:GGDEF domain-containing protein [Ancylobacter gelatini]MCJ8142566.1 diguanylate cyclase [Ancylobacter gelatini]